MKIADSAALTTMTQPTRYLVIIIAEGAKNSRYRKLDLNLRQLIIMNVMKNKLNVYSDGCP